MYCSWLSIATILKSKASQNPLFLHVLKNTLRWHKSENDSRLWQLELLSIFLWISEDNWVAMKWRLLGWWVWFTFSQLTLVHRVHLLLDAFWHRVFLQNQDHGLLRRHHHALFVVILTIYYLLTESSGDSRVVWTDGRGNNQVHWKCWSQLRYRVFWTYSEITHPFNI